MSASCCHVVGDALGIHVPSTSHVGCCVGTLCQLACPSRRPSSSPPRSRWVVVGRSRTIRRSHVLSCGEGCLMTLEGCGRHAAGRLRRMRRKKAATLRPTSMSLLALLFPSSSFGLLYGNPPFPCPRCRLYGTFALRRACSVPGGGWDSVGRVIVADGCWRAARLSTLWPYTRALAVFAHVSTHGRLAWTACKRRVNFSL